MENQAITKETKDKLKNFAELLQHLTKEQQEQGYCIMFGMKIANELNRKNQTV